MRNSHLAALLGAAALLTGPVLVAAQAPPTPVKSNPTGFHVAGAVHGAGIVFEGDSDAESGAGGGLALGWGLNRTVTLFVQGSAASIDMAGYNETYTLAHFDVGARFNFRGPQAKALPYLTAALSGRSAGLDVAGDLLTITGVGGSVGGGLAVFLSPSAALDFGVLWTMGSFTEAEYQGMKETVDVSATSARVNIGVSWWAGR